MPGRVAVPVNTLMTEDDYRFMLADSGARMLVVSQALLPKFEKLVAALPEFHLVVAGSHKELPHQDLDKLIADVVRRGAAPSPTTCDSIAFWLYTSGSTGKPKAAVHVHADLRLTNDLYAAPILGITENDVCFSVAKLFFAYGLGNAMTFPLSVGATTRAAAGPADARRRRRSAASKHQVTVFYAVPTFYAAFLASPAAPARAELKLRCCISAGEALPPDIGRRWRERYGVDILDGLGSTEMLHIFLSNRPGDVKYGTSGKPVPGYDIRLVGDDGNVIEAPGEMGELQVRGPTSAVMYWNNREQSRTTFLGEWTRSGDKYIQDDARLLRLLRPARRHAEGRRHLCLAVRGRGRAAEPSGRAGSRGRRLAGRGRIDQAQGLRRAEIGGRRLRHAGACVAGALQAETRALQISALDRVPDRSSEDRHRKNPALQAAGRD